MDQSKTQITNPERVARIINKICQANLRVFIRATENITVAVKGKASNMVSAKTPDGSRIMTIRISNISNNGLNYLANKQKIQIEFILMATKVVFVSRVLNIDQNQILISMPTKLISIERRKNARYLTNENMLGFLDLSVWNNSENDFAATPIFPHYNDIRNNISLADVSIGGVCAVTSFPSVSQELTRGCLDDGAKLIFPMQEPIPVAFEVRWVKRIKEQKKCIDGVIRSTISYRFGCEFVNQSEDSLTALRQFMRQIGQSEAI
jgi:hypothetical protein